MDVSCCENLYKSHNISCFIFFFNLSKETISDSLTFDFFSVILEVETCSCDLNNYALLIHCTTLAIVRERIS